LEDVDAGVYFGWAVIEASASDSSKVKNTPIKAVVNVGYSPTFEGKENKEKIVEAHLITKASPMTKYECATETNHNEIDAEDVEINDDFYGETMRLQLIGFLRSEQKFDSFPDLIAQIHRDIGLAASALDSFPYVFSKEDEFISNCNDAAWIGSGGGDGTASWEYESW
jgi:FAD synthase